MNRTLNTKILVAMNLIQEQLSTLSTESTLTLLLQEPIAVPMTDISTSSPSTHQLDPITQLQNHDNSNKEKGDGMDLSHSLNQAMEIMRQFDQMDVPGSCRHASNKNHSLSALVSKESPTSPNKTIVNLSTCKRRCIQSWKKDTLVNNMIIVSDIFKVILDREKEQETLFELQPSQGTIIFDEGSNKSHQCYASTCKLSFTQNVGFTQIITEQQLGFMYTQTESSQSQETNDTNQSIQAELCSKVKAPGCALQTQITNNQKEFYNSINVSITSNPDTMSNKLSTPEYQQPVHMGSSPSTYFGDGICTISSKNDASLKTFVEQHLICTPGQSAKQNIPKVVCLMKEASIIHTCFSSNSKKDADDTNDVKYQAFAHRSPSSTFHTAGPSFLISLLDAANLKCTDNTDINGDNTKLPSEFKTNIPYTSEPHSTSLTVLHSSGEYQITNFQKIIIMSACIIHC
jgi:hypothetical protein